MKKQKKNVTVEYNDFTRGFITEASPLTFPENASIDEMNMNINRDGSRQRRFGMDWDAADDTIVTSSTNLATTGNAVSTYTWRNVNNDGSQNLQILQIGKTLHFFILETKTWIYSLSLAYTGAALADYPFEYASIYGKLFVAAGGIYPILLEYDTYTTVTGTYLDFKMRDLFGIEDGNATDNRPTTLVADHEYNLRNQGWPDKFLCSPDAAGSTNAVLKDPIDWTYTSGALVGGTLSTPVDAYPSNADIIWTSRLSSTVSTGITSLNSYSPWDLNKQLLGTTPAPKGKFIIDVFDRGASRQTESGITLATADANEATDGGIYAVAAYAGRVWYGIQETGTGIVSGDNNSPRLGNMVFYSKASSDISKLYTCCTENDPTSEIINDVLDTDGGFVNIPGSGTIYKLVPFGSSLFVFASNGVWEIFGSDSGVFSATNQSVSLTTNIGPISKSSVVVCEGFIAYWAKDGIYIITIDKSSLRGIASNITLDTIQSYYDGLSKTEKSQAVGEYDALAKQVKWIYHSSAKDSEFYQDKELVYDLGKNAFTKREINEILNRNNASDLGPYLVGYYRLLEDYPVGGYPDGEQDTKSSLLYWISDYDVPDETFYIGAYSEVNFVDYPKVYDTVNTSYGYDAFAYLITGYLTGGDSSHVKETPYIYVKLKRTETTWSIDGSGVVTMENESSCFMQAQWQWTNNPLAGKWSTVQQVYRFPRFFLADPSHTLSYDVINTKNKVKGSGEALSLYFYSEAGKNLHLYGWGIPVEMDEND